MLKFIAGLILLVTVCWLLLRIFIDYVTWKLNKDKERFMKYDLPRLRVELIDIVNAICLEHVDVLSRKRKQKSYTDDYNNLITQDWDNEKKYFFDNSICTNKHINEHFSVSFFLMSDEEKAFELESLREFFYKKVDEITVNENFEPDEKVDVMTGEEFEFEIEENLKRKGWNVVRTPKTSDQGIDLLIKKNNISVAIQCKRYSTPVGNSAVQEVYSGKEHYKADYAAVVSNQTYTKSARQLSGSTNVMLLHYSDLDVLEELALHVELDS